MVLAIPDKVLKLWNAWNLRVSVLISLFLQTLLIFLAPLRKRKKDKWVSLVIWLAYLLADWIAAYAIGLICNSNSSSSDKNGNLLMFWAPFLLLHLGGPDTITAFALEDNELWLRHLLGLFFQVFVTVYTLLQSQSKNPLLIPTILMFISGILKYVERTRALYLACLDNLRESMFQEPAPYKDTIEASERFDRVSMLETQNGALVNLHNVAMVQSAYNWFRTFRGIIVDNVFSIKMKENTQVFFHKRNGKEAFRFLEIELAFMYEFLYTKAFVIHSLIGYIFRFIGFCFVLIAFSLFLFVDKNGLHEVDIGVTYTLLIGAMSIDIISLVMLIFSDWTIVALKNSNAKFSIIVSTFLTKVPIFNGPRWSESLPQYNLICHCLNERPDWINKMANYLCINNFLDEIQFNSYKPVTDKLKEFIFAELKTKSTLIGYWNISEMKKMVSSRGDWVLKENDCNELCYSITEVEYDVSLLAWHIATELCYCISEGEGEGDNTYIKDCREFSKLLSDYLLYLLVMQPSLMSSVAGLGKISYLNTYEDVKEFFSIGESKPSHDQACRNLLFQGNIRQERTDSLLYGRNLANKLREYPNNKRWKIMSKVWVEMLGYAASHCNANIHAQQLSKGGELITYVWLLMIHLGLGEQFVDN